ncbi:phosphotransferase [Virgisporangium aliadipatigenens]|uniref:Phosphotransferase n=1 Tax=Virgisporangium aliadipatigenens TaxID=741659 RepID=A0A8J3YM58_9ACTN|nr:phosphotransferase [Virgisporangium aliadipatigenens]GIJ46475.1 phosphotransferase [Virgisporangium aliadipatigenens]
MRSPTQVRLTPGQLEAYARQAFGADAVLADCAELGGGGFAAVWRLRLADGRTGVLKVGPPPGVRLLRYERDLIDAEAGYLRLVRERAQAVPTPEILYHGGNWMVTTLLPGTALPDLPPGADDAPVRHGLGAAVAHLHRVTGPRFGYPGLRVHRGAWRAAFTAMVEDLLSDGDDWGVPLPVSARRVREAVARHAWALDRVERPALLHFDLWDGNVLAVTDDGGGLALGGLVDGERYLFGDPLVDFVSPALRRRIEDEPEHPFVRGYESVAGPVRFDNAARRRLALYRLHLYLLMLVEMPSRAMVGPSSVERRERLGQLFTEEMDVLGG